NANEFVTALNYSTTSNTVLSSAQTVLGSTAANSLNLTATGGLTINPMQILTLANTTGATGASGGLLAQEGNSGLTGGFINANGLALYVYTPAVSAASTTTA